MTSSKMLSKSKQINGWSKMKMAIIECVQLFRFYLLP